MSAPAKLPREAVSTIRMTTGGEKRHPRVICDGMVCEWVGFGWVREREPTAEDFATLPQVEDAA